MDSKNTNINARKAIFEQNLRDGSDEFIISTLEELRESGEDYIVDPIINLLFSNRTDVLKDAVVNFLIDIKKQSVTTIIINAIKNNVTSKDLSHLVSVCWQSRLDFSAEIDLFVELLCKSDYQTSFEASTVIENCLDSISEDKIAEYIAFLKKEINKTPQSKQALVQHMTLVMEEFVSGK